MTSWPSLLIIVLLLLESSVSVFATNWQDEFAKMPLPKNATELNEKNVVPTLLPAFKRNPAVKALIFMPGATDEFYFFHRARVTLTNSAPTLLDAIVTLTNQTLIRATVRPPFLVLHTAEDPLEPVSLIEDQSTAERIKKKKFAKHALYDDLDWDGLHPIISFYTDTKTLPGLRSSETFHFFRNSFAAYDLTAWEALEATAMAGKTQFRIQKKKILFEGDPRFLANPPAPKNFLMDRLN